MQQNIHIRLILLSNARFIFYAVKFYWLKQIFLMIITYIVLYNLLDVWEIFCQMISSIKKHDTFWGFLKISAKSLIILLSLNNFTKYQSTKKLFLLFFVCIKNIALSAITFIPSSYVSKMCARMPRAALRPQPDSVGCQPDKCEDSPSSLTSQILPLTSVNTGHITKKESQQMMKWGRGLRGWEFISEH